MKNTKFQLKNSSIVAAAVPVALFLYRYLQVNQLSSLFTIEFLLKVVATALLAMVGIVFVFCFGSVAPGMFDVGGKEEPDPQIWTIFGGVLLAIFVMLLWNVPLKKDKQYETVDNRSYYMFVDGKNMVHYDPKCQKTYYADKPWQAIIYSSFNLDIDIRDYSVCDHCTWVFYDVYDDIVHESLDCISLTIKKHDDLDRANIAEMFEQDVDLCPYCY